MKKDEKKRNARAHTGRDVVRDWLPLFGRFQDTVEWALDLAARLASGYEQDLEAIERVRSYLHGWLDGRRIDIDTNDILTTLAILFAAIELDTGIDSSPFLHAMRGLTPAFHLPGAARDESPTVVIRRLPRYRNGGAFTQFAA